MITVRIRFEKVGEAAYISLLDLQRVFHRILKRSGLPVYYTQGYNPHIYLSFACPLSLGQESVCESCEVKTEEEQADFAAWQAILQPYMPQGIRVISVAPARDKVTEIETATYQIALPAAAAPALEAYNAAEQAVVLKKSKRGQKETDLKAYCKQVEYTVGAQEVSFTLTLPCGTGEALSLNPGLLLGYLQQTHNIPPWQCRVLRTCLYTKNGEEFC